MSDGKWFCLNCGFLKTVKLVLTESAEYDVEVDGDYSPLSIYYDHELTLGLEPDRYIEQHLSAIYCPICGEELDNANFTKKR